jgi:hypothetical protein
MLVHRTAVYGNLARREFQSGEVGCLFSYGREFARKRLIIGGFSETDRSCRG